MSFTCTECQNSCQNSSCSTCKKIVCASCIRNHMAKEDIRLHFCHKPEFAEGLIQALNLQQVVSNFLICIHCHHLLILNQEPSKELMDRCTNRKCFNNSHHDYLKFIEYMQMLVDSKK